MAEMLIDGAKLDACNTAEADAIRAKTGGSSPIPYDYANNKGFADAIAAIPTGGGGIQKVLLADYTAAEDVSAIQIDFTEAMQGYELYEILLTGTFNKQPYPYVGVNTATNTRYLNGFNNNHNWGCYIKKFGTGYAAFLGAGVHYPVASLQYFHTRAYVADAYFRAGFNVKIWGYSA